MEEINIITDDLKKEILELLYRDEMYNATLIKLIQEDTNNLGELYVNETQEGIADILHIKNDGNSDFTNFIYTSNDGLKDIACKIKELNYKNILLAGRLKDVNSLLQILEYKKSITPNIFYKLNIEKYNDLHMQYQSSIRLANLNSEDLERVKQFTAHFLEAETEEQIKAITDTEKILTKMKAGVYILNYENNAIGMARFIGKTNNYEEITSVYICEAYRRKGFGKELIGHMIEIAIQEQKTPVLATSITNTAAMRTYESMGFERQGEYAYEFLE